MNDRFRLLARVAGALAILLGGTVLLGWIFDVAVLTSVVPGLVTMKRNSAASFILSGASLLLALNIEHEAAARRTWIGHTMALVVAAAGALTLAEYVFNVDLGIDQLLGRAPLEEPQTSSPGRMALVSALCFTLAGTALAFLDSPVRAFRQMAVASAFVVLLAGYLASVGYLLDVEALFGVAGYTSMAVHTAVGLVVLSIGILASRPTRGVVAILAQDTAAGAAIRRLLPLIVAAPLAVAWVRLKGQQAGLYGTEFGLALMVTFSTGIIGSLALWNARIQGASENEKKRASEQFRLAIEAAPTGMLMIDRAGRIVLANAQVEALFGYQREELMGMPIEMLVPERFRERHPGYRGAFFHDPQARPMGGGRDLYGSRKDGTEVPIEIGLNPLRTAEGDFVLGSVADITERKRAEREKEGLLGQLKTLNADLEERVRIRTGELTNSLTEREVLLQEVHHRVKNNLQVISSLISMQARKLEEGTSRDALEECETRVQSIALVHEQLYQSKDYARVSISAYARSLASNVFRALGVSPARVSLQLAIDDVELAVDRAIPCGLLLNELITNSLKHGFKDGRSGNVRVELGLLEGGLLRLAVTDDGAGLPDGMDILKSESLGLQLICTLAEQLEAKLEVGGQRGGAAFKLTFPCGGPG